ncbi:MAG TPA: hypothetical protein PKY33_04015 [Limnohabitans sp.]|jgi:hypothetical protein|uniref:hypothetical protein n=1 Tax=Limnohabitans sp. TaxID=1907725 RepID=UPI00269ED780|nr:hypothetical protein [Limnohabitans sp.]HQR85891.1 hypothetical protein [Limnohabitans sp.]HQS26193.1 hypothetical protein [Limnohabitans sp.]
MKRVSALLACLLTFAVVLPAQAGGHGHGGGRGGHSVQHFGGHGHVQSHVFRHGAVQGHGYGSHYRGSSNHWLAPVLGAAIVGSVIYSATTPSYAAPVVVQQQYAPPHRVAYFCSTSQQYYPNVPTCQVPWQPVNY